jgi:TorA maturation chaperone TorD
MEQVLVHRPSTASSPCPEDLARADWYTLIGALFQSPPDAALLARIASAVEPAADAQADSQSDLAREFARLAGACASAGEDAVKQEYDTVFLGVGRPEVFLNASYYLSGFLHERPLADLREELANLGLARREEYSQTEDQIGSLCEVMRLLIVDGGAMGAGLDVQRAFFTRFIAPWFEQMCDALEQCDSTRFYKDVGRLAKAFFAVERLAFDFES